MDDDVEPPPTDPITPAENSVGRAVTDDDRKRKVANQIRMEVTSGGRIESQGDFDAVVATGKDVNHTVHLIATIFTCGIWGLVWLVIALTGGVKRKMVSVDEYGQLLVQSINTK